MKKKLLIVSVLILVVLAASGFIVSAVTVGRIEAALGSPLQLGVMTLYPGSRIDSHVGYFKSRVTVEDSVIEFGPSRFDVPAIEVRLNREKLFIDADRAFGKVVQLDPAEVTITGIRLEAPYQGLMDRKAEMTARMTMDTVAIEGAEQHYRLKDSSLEILRSQHDFWDKLVLEIAEMKADDQQVSASVADGKFIQTQIPNPDGRLAVVTKVHLGGIKVKDLKEKAEFGAGQQELEIGAAIDGDKTTIFVQTLRELTPDENAFNRYLEKYHPRVDTVSFQGSEFSLHSKEAAIACAGFRMDSHYQQQDELAESGLESVLTKLSLTANGSRMEAGEISLTSSARINADRQNRFIQLVSNFQAHALAEILDAAYGLFDSYHADTRWAVSDLTYAAPGQQRPIRVQDGSLAVAIVFAQGVGNLSISPKLTCTDLDSLPQVAALQLGLDRVAAGLGIALNRINLQAFRPLLAHRDSTKSQPWLAAADTAARAFADSKPQAQISFDLSGQAGPALAVSLLYEIEQALPKDFSLAPALQGSASLEQVIGQGLGKASAVRLTLHIDQYPKLMALLDRVEGPGSGAQFLQQVSAFVKIEGERIEGELLIRDQKALLNGEPNPLIQFFVNQLLNSSP